MKFDYDDDLLYSNNSVTSVDKSDFNSSTKEDYQQQDIDNILSDSGFNSDKKDTANSTGYDPYGTDFNSDKDNNTSNYPDNNSSEFNSEIDNHYDDYGKTDLDKLILNQNKNLDENVDQQSMNSLYYNSADEDLQQDEATLMQAEQDRIDHTDDNSDEKHSFWHDMFSSYSTIADDDSDSKSDEDDEPHYQDPHYQDPTYTSQYDDNDK